MPPNVARGGRRHLGHVSQELLIESNQVTRFFILFRGKRVIAHLRYAGFDLGHYWRHSRGKGGGDEGNRQDAPNVFELLPLELVARRSLAGEPAVHEGQEIASKLTA